MEMLVTELPGSAVSVELVGRLDTLGVDAVEMRFNAAALAAGRSALVDMSRVEFVSSMGVRLLITAAKTMKARQQRLLLVVPEGSVREMLETAAIDTLIPMFVRRDDALAVLAG
jgi:anti-sigma B factor antagonist/stage II sporulation protein AA (anti-sigma F factor antagonist)